MSSSFILLLSGRLMKGTLGIMLAMTHSAVMAQTLSAPQLSTPTAAVSSETRPQPVSLNEKTHVLDAGDRLHIEILDEFEGEYQVSVDGTLELPLVGSLTLVGMTVKEATTLLKQEYSQYLRYPDITLRLLAPRPLDIAIYGEVFSPGTYVLSPEETNDAVKLTQALQLAGGVTQAADIRRVEVRRRHQGKEQTLQVDLQQLLQTGQLDQDLALRDEDTIFIPTSEEIDHSSMRQVASATFATQNNRPVDIAVVGEVARPGTYTLNTRELGEDTEGQLPTVTQALEIAGGITHASDVRHIKVHRMTRTGSELVIDVDLWALLQSGDLHQDVILQAGDTVVVPEVTNLSPTETRDLAAASFAPDTIRINVVGEVGSPGLVEVPANTPLNQALLSAGGFTDEANQKTVELVRLNPNGTVTQRTIKIDFTQGINEANNPILHDQDVIITKRTNFRNVFDTLGVISAPFFPILRLFEVFGD